MLHNQMANQYQTKLLVTHLPGFACPSPSLHALLQDCHGSGVYDMRYEQCMVHAWVTVHAGGGQDTAWWQQASQNLHD